MSRRLDSPEKIAEGEKWLAEHDGHYWDEHFIHLAARRAYFRKKVAECTERKRLREARDVVVEAAVGSVMELARQDAK